MDPRLTQEMSGLNAGQHRSAKTIVTIVYFSQALLQRAFSRIQTATHPMAILAELEEFGLD